MKILYSSQAIRTAIREIFKDTDKPCGAYVAFVGAGAPDYLPNDLSNFELICWLKPGATDPTALRKLAHRKARLFYADGLHMKVYWSSAGAVIASANLSDNGLGDGGLGEMGMQLPPNALDIKQIRRGLSATPIQESDLIEYERRHTVYIARNAGSTMFGSRRNGRGRAATRKQPLSFVEWYELPYRRRWRWAAYTEYYEEIGRASRVTLKQQGRKSWESHMTGSKEILGYGTKPGEQDWILCVDLRDDGDGIEWLYPDSVVKLTPDDDGWSEDGQYEAVQMQKTHCYGSTPFLEDDRFERALRESMKEFVLTTEAKIGKASKDGRMPDRLLTAIYHRLKTDEPLRKSRG